MPAEPNVSNCICFVTSKKKEREENKHKQKKTKTNALAENIKVSGFILLELNSRQKLQRLEDITT